MMRHACVHTRCDVSSGRLTDRNRDRARGSLGFGIWDDLPLWQLACIDASIARLLLPLLFLVDKPHQGRREEAASSTH